MKNETKSVDQKIKSAHDRHGCSNWQTWQSNERDQNGAKFVATWKGCQNCGVKILQ